ncbi:MAG: endonuclease III [Alphaproteobacteria bacterium]|nr:endonuclease III [Alphaproteobacteria bacterium]
MSKNQVEEFFKILANDNPTPKTELNYTNDYTLLVAVVLSAQATDTGVNKATAKLFEIADTPNKMLKLGHESLIEHIRTIGLFRNKAKNIISLSEQLIAEYAGKVPASRESLESLPGVGRKTANVILNTAFSEPTIAVDTHIFRLANRTGLAIGDSVLDVEKNLLRRVPKTYMKHAHHWLILHGRYVCKARSPRCNVCIVVNECRYKEKSI